MISAEMLPEQASQRIQVGGGEDVSISYFKQRGKKAQPGQESKW